MASRTCAAVLALVLVTSLSAPALAGAESEAESPCDTLIACAATPPAGAIAEDRLHLRRDCGRLRATSRRCRSRR